MLCTVGVGVVLRITALESYLMNPHQKVGLVSRSSGSFDRDRDRDLESLAFDFRTLGHPNTDIDAMH